MHMSIKCAFVYICICIWYVVLYDGKHALTILGYIIKVHLYCILIN